MHDDQKESCYTKEGKKEGECCGKCHTDDTPEIAAKPAENLSVDEQLAAALIEIETHKEAFLRAKAESENIRRRAQEDVLKAHKFSTEKFAADLLAVKDSLDAALIVENPSVESYKEGCELTLKQLVSAFERSGVKEVNPADEKFNPHHHQAISMVESDKEAGTVVSVLQKGYLIAERVLRPALVMVAK